MSHPDVPQQAKLPLGFTGHVVCVGASAGGLDALERFFAACPADTGAAYVVVQHLSPDHKSMMANLLSRHTPMPVAVVENDMAILADHVYLIPPGAIMHASPGQLHLVPKNPRGLTLPIDIFLSSAAEAFGRRAVGVILSGTGSDGARGAVAVNAAGGFLIAQKPDTAKFDGMPRSLIGTGLADAVLAPQDIPARLVQLFGAVPGDAMVRETGAPREPMDPDQMLERIFHLLRGLGGIAFQDYKPATVMRRIERRMQVRRAHGLAAYLALLEADHEEVLTLRRELLIPVTSFFRDPGTFEALATSVVPGIVARAGTNDTVRVWCAGVSSGEEPYSVAMLFLEEFERARRWPALKVFATDVDPMSLDTAGNGQYPESAAAELTPARLERFFTRQDERIQVKNELRQCMVFARHNLLEDPPFTRMDLVVCRNVLIYFRSEAQQRALHTLKYAVNPGGCLLLGSSESLGSDAEGFRALDARNKLFQRTGYVGPLAPERLAGSSGTLTRSQRVPAVRQPPARPREDGHVEAGAAALLARFTPPAILLNANHQALHLYGAVQPYLRMKGGQASLELSRILPDSLAPVASALAYKASRDVAAATADAVRATLADGSERLLRLTALPVPSGGDAPFTLLCIEESAPQAAGRDATVDLGAETMEHVQMLERELAATRASLQVSIEELETANEELQATNEELMASNEELQSSNEELQSVNEELNTVNAEFQEKMLILNRLNADLDSMGKASGVATVFVDSNLLLKRFNPDATRIFKLREADLGRRLDDFAHNLDYAGLIADIEHTLRNHQSLEREILSRDGTSTYLMRLLPYTVPSSGEAGAVLAFDDIGPLRHAERLQAVLDALPEHVAVLGADGHILLVNQAWRDFARANGDPELAHSGPGANYLSAHRATSPEVEPSAAAAMEGVRGVLDGSARRFSIEYPCHSPDQRRWFLMHAAPVEGHSAYRAVVSHVNITDWYGQGR